MPGVHEGDRDGSASSKIAQHSSFLSATHLGDAFERTADAQDSIMDALNDFAHASLDARLFS